MNWYYLKILSKYVEKIHNSDLELVDDLKHNVCIDNNVNKKIIDFLRNK